MRSLQEQLSGVSTPNPIATPRPFAEDDIDDLEGTDEDWLKARMETFNLPGPASPSKLLEPLPIESPLGVDNPEFRSWRRELSETLLGKTAETGVSLAGKGLSLVGDVFTRVNKVATAVPIVSVSVDNMKTGAEMFNANLHHAIRYWGMISSMGQMGPEEAREWADSFVDTPRSYWAIGKDSLMNFTPLFTGKEVKNFLATTKAAITPVPGAMKEFPTFAEKMGKGYYKTLTGEDPSEAWKQVVDTSFEMVITSPQAVSSLVQKAQNIKSLGAGIGIFSKKPLTAVETFELAKSHTATGLTKLAKTPEVARAELWKINKMKWYHRWSTLEWRMNRRALDYQAHFKALSGTDFRVAEPLSQDRLDAGRSIMERLLSGVKPAQKVAKEEKKASLARKYSEAAGMRKGVKGSEEAAKAARYALKGDDYVHDFDVDLSWLTQSQRDQLFSIINSMDEWDAQHASTALWKILDKKLPNRSEAAVLEKAFGMRVGKQLEALVDRPLDIAEFGTDLMNVPRAMQTSFDLGAPFRQGDFALKSGYADEWASAVSTMIKAGGPKKFAQHVDDLATFGPRAALYKQAGLAHTKAGKTAKLLEREEAYLGQLAENIPLFGRGIKWSERTHTAFLNKLRMDLFDTHILRWQLEGRTIKPKDYKALAEYVNHVTGRGDFKTAERALKGVFGLAGKEITNVNVPAVASGFMYSPRFFLSKIQVHTDLFATNSNLVRRLVARDLANYYRTNVQILRMAAAGGDYLGWEVETDPTSGEYGKIRAGNTRWDIWGPMNPIMRHLARQESGKAKSITTKDVYDVDRNDLNLRFMRSQASPTLGLIWTLASGENFVGDDISITSKKDMKRLAFETFVPLGFQDINDALRWGENGPWAKAAVGTAFVGVGTTTYEPDPFQKAYQMKEVLSRELFGKPIQDLNTVERVELQKTADYNPAISMLDKQGMFESPDDIVEIASKNAVKTDRDIRKTLPPNIQSALDRTYTTIGPISKQIKLAGTPVRLKDREFTVFKKLIGKNIERYMVGQSADQFLDAKKNEKIVYNSIRAAEKELGKMMMEADLERNIRRSLEE
jgi:hypothetical protein